MNFKSDAEKEQFLCQLHNLYNHNINIKTDNHGLYDIVYDKLVEDGHKIKFSPEIKQELWTKARNRFKTKEKALILEFKKNKWPEDALKVMLHKYFKSILAAKYVMNKLEQDDITLVLKDDATGKEVKMLNIVGLLDSLPLKSRIIFSLIIPSSVTNFHTLPPPANSSLIGIFIMAS